MVDPDDYKDLVDVGAFPELSGDVGFVGCFFDGSSTRGCAQHRTDQDDKRYSISTDISLNANGSGIGIDPPVLDIGDSDITEQHETVLPTEVHFNKCHMPSSGAYQTLIHEAGHALGIRGGGHPPVDNQRARYTVMSTSFGFGCQPHPFDIMAIYALYQPRIMP